MKWFTVNLKGLSHQILLGSDINQKPWLGHATPDITFFENFNWPFKFLSILQQTHSNSPVYWIMKSVNTESIPNCTRCMPSHTRYLHFKSIEML
jgi:hypothetical protein